MPEIEVGGESESGGSGLVALVVAVMEILVEALEREAVRRMESGRLSDEETERLGARLASIEAEIERIKEEEGVDSEVSDLRAQLDGLVEEAIHDVAPREAEQPNAGADVPPTWGGDDG